MTYRMHRYRRLRSLGLCVSCGKMKSRQTLCSWCRDQHAKAPSVGRGTSPACKRAWRAKRKQEGLCGDCGEPSGTFARCEICRSKKNAVAQESRRMRTFTIKGVKPQYCDGVQL